MSISYASASEEPTQSFTRYVNSGYVSATTTVTVHPISTSSSTFIESVTGSVLQVTVEPTFTLLDFNVQQYVETSHDTTSTTTATVTRQENTVSYNVVTRTVSEMVRGFVMSTLYSARVIPKTSVSISKSVTNVVTQTIVVKVDPEPTKVYYDLTESAIKYEY